MKWYAISTLPGYEKKLKSQLERKHIPCFCPSDHFAPENEGSTATMEGDIFPACIFAKVEETGMPTIRKMKGVVNFLYWRESPVEIPDQEIEALKHFLRENRRVHIEKREVNPQESISYTVGPFMFEKSNEVTISSNVLKLSLPTLGYDLMAEISEVNLQIIKRANLLSPGE